MSADPIQTTAQDCPGKSTRDLYQSYLAERVVQTTNPAAHTRLPDGTLSPSVPEPFSYGFLPWLWKRLTGWRDAYGQPAQRMTWRG